MERARPRSDENGNRNRPPGVFDLVGREFGGNYNVGDAARINLLQRSNDLRLRVPAPAHPSFPVPSSQSYSEMDGFSGSGQRDQLFTTSLLVTLTTRRPTAGGRSSRTLSPPTREPATALLANTLAFAEGVQGSRGIGVHVQPIELLAIVEENTSNGYRDRSTINREVEG